MVFAAYHALQQLSLGELPNICTLLPLFYEKAATSSMIKHGMDVQRQAIACLNTGQILAIAKNVQWKWPSTHGEQMHVVMVGVYIQKWHFGEH